MFRPKLPSFEKVVDVGIVLVILLVVFQLFPIIRFWERIPPVIGGAKAA